MSVLTLLFPILALAILAASGLEQNWYWVAMCATGAWFMLSVGVMLAARAARRRIKADASLSGKGWALAGSILGYATLLLSCIAVYVVITAVPSAILNGCVSSLRQIDGAKEQWAVDNKKTATDTPTWDDLIGPEKYIKTRPTCPGSGIYTLNDMAHKPRCSIPEHSRVW